MIISINVVIGMFLNAFSDDLFCENYSYNDRTATGFYYGVHYEGVYSLLPDI